MATSERDESPETGAAVGDDEQRLHELGYRQELSRAWSGFTNFAISFTIISVLAGTFTTFAFDVSLVNYTPLAIVLPLAFGLWYLVSAKDRYQGPVRTLEEDEITAG